MLFYIITTGFCILFVAMLFAVYAISESRSCYRACSRPRLGLDTDTDYPVTTPDSRPAHGSRGTFLSKKAITASLNLCKLTKKSMSLSKDFQPLLCNFAHLSLSYNYMSQSFFEIILKLSY